MLFTVKWYPKFIMDFKRIGSLFSFGWKLLASGLLNTLYEDLRSLVIGKKYDSGTLGYYNRGKQFPQFFIGAINGAVQTVLLPAMSKKQDDKAQVKEFARTSIVVSSYILFPMMMGLAVVAEPMVRLLLTEKWLPCVPYLQVYCFILAFTPIHSCNLQAINAMGRSDIFLKLEIIKKVIGITSLVIAVFCFETPLAIALTGAFTTVISSFINAFPNKKLINYSYLEQVKDLLPSFIVAGLMGVGVYLINYINLNDIVTLLIQIPTGIALYLGFSALFGVKGFVYLKTLIGAAKDKKQNKLEEN
jgi:O-antigen/teichoic acid export membrane protein